MAKPHSSTRCSPFSTAAALCAVFAAAIAISSVGAFSPSQIKARPVKSTTSPTSLSATAAAAPPSYALFGLAVKRASQSSSSNSKPLFSIPSIFNAADSRPVVLFDGKCNLCNAGVQLVLDTDRASSDPRGNLRVAALQSRVGKVLLSRLPPEQRETVLSLTDDSSSKEYKSIVVAGEDQTWLNSAACIRIGKELKGPLRYLALLASLIPAFIRDPLYKLMSRYRKRLFGEAPECRLWDDNWDTRFVDDGLFGGRSESDNMFADPNAEVEEEEVDEDDVVLEDAPPGSPPLKAGDSVRVISPKAILHSHVEGYENEGLCSVGMVGTVTRVLERRAYPKNVAVKFQLESDSIDDESAKETKATTSFEAHFFPGQLRKE